MKTLRDEGFRFGWTGSKWDWVHPSMVEDSFIDCTEMDDDHFEKLVRIIGGEKYENR